MKKIFLILFVLFAINLNAQDNSKQLIIQNVSTNFDSLVYVCYDTTVRIDYVCDIYAKIDSVKLIPQYDVFLDMCKQLSNSTVITNVTCQNTTKQTLTPYRRIIVRNGIQQWIFNVELLTTDEQKVYNDFIEKIKSQL